MATVAQFRTQYTRNAADLAKIAEKAATVAPKKHRGATADEWKSRAEWYARIAAASDDALIAHIVGTAPIA